MVVGNYQVFKYFLDKLEQSIPFNLYNDIDEINVNNLPVFLNIPESYNINIREYIGTKSIEGAKIALKSLTVALKIIEKFKLPILITMPVCKETIQKIHPQFLGQTELLANSFLSKNVFQTYFNDTFFYTLLTSHIPLRNVKNYITLNNIEVAVSKIQEFFGYYFDKKDIKLAILCLNPHCGEFLKNREEDKIKSIVENLRRKNINIEGPYSFEYSIKLFEGGKIDACIGIYHDQIIPPLKILTKMNLTELNIGLPVLRLGPVHGVGFDIANQYKADFTSTAYTLKIAHKYLKEILSKKLGLFYNLNSNE
ncbi:MAG: 4-hydroxythreonine-4-phosphate dehydrogenase PdxA [Planctomycetota bacterium]